MGILKRPQALGPDRTVLTEARGSWLAGRAVINTCFVVGFSQLYKRIAHFLNKFEPAPGTIHHPRTQTHARDCGCACVRV